MSDTEKPTPESPDAGTSEAPASPSGGSANVISIEQARAELLRKPRSRATPPKGLGSPGPRSRGREVPMPVTLPPGEHSAVIVTDTPAARAHIDKKTVHPGELPAEMTNKKVRVKTQYDPRRQKTQVTDRRATPVPGEAEVANIWSTQPPSQPPPPILTSSQPPPPITGSQRPSLVRPRPMTREGNSSAPLFLVGVALAAALGAVLVYMLSRPRSDPNGPAPSGSTAVTATIPGPVASSAGSAVTTSAPAAETTSEAGDTGAQAPELPSSVPATPVKTGHSVTPRPTATATATTTATAKPTTTSILPFGKEEP